MATPEQTPRKLSLEVLPYFGKVEELKKAPPAAAAPPPLPRSIAFLPHALREGQELAQGKDPALLSVESQVVEALRTIFDPEIPVNIYDLGLVYEIHIDPERRVKIDMTLTAPGCPVAGILPKAVERKIEAIDDVRSCEVELVWEPQWNKGMMSEAARLELGLL